MKLWILSPKEPRRPRPQDPWGSIYDCAYGFVVRAETEADARMFAQRETGDEGGIAWTSEYSDCLELKPGGIAGVMMRDFNAG